MATLTEARARWVQENPIGSPGFDLSQAAYDALADDRATIMLAQMEQDEDEAERKQLAQDVRTALALLDGNATLAQTRTILARLIRYLVRTGAIG